jgi:hypothetical protein
MQISNLHLYKISNHETNYTHIKISNIITYQDLTVEQIFNVLNKLPSYIITKFQTMKLTTLISKFQT